MTILLSRCSGFQRQNQMSSSLQIAAEKARAPRGWSGSTRILIVVGLSRPPPTGGAGSRCSSRCFMSAVRASHWQRSYSPLSPACIVFFYYLKAAARRKTRWAELTVGQTQSQVPRSAPAIHSRFCYFPLPGPWFLNNPFRLTSSQDYFRTEAYIEESYPSWEIETVQPGAGLG